LVAHVCSGVAVHNCARLFWCGYTQLCTSVLVQLPILRTSFLMRLYTIACVPTWQLCFADAKAQQLLTAVCLHLPLRDMGRTHIYAHARSFEAYESMHKCESWHSSFFHTHPGSVHEQVRAAFCPSPIGNAGSGLLRGQHVQQHRGFRGRI